MNALLATNIVAGALYGIFVDSTYIYIYLAVLIPFTVVTQFLMRNLKEHTKRKGTQIATWGHPSDPSAYLCNDFECAGALKHLVAVNKDIKDDPLKKVTFNHMVVKAIAWGAWK